MNLTQIVINDTTKKKLSRVLMNKMSATPEIYRNGKVDSVDGRLEVVSGDWFVPPRPTPNVRRVFVIYAEDQNLETFHRALNLLSSGFLPGDKLLVAQQIYGLVNVTKHRCTDFNYTQLLTDLKNIDARSFIKVVCDLVLYDDLPIRTSC